MLAWEGHQEEERKEELQEHPRQVTDFRGGMDDCRKPPLAWDDTGVHLRASNMSGHGGNKEPLPGDL